MGTRSRTRGGAAKPSFERLEERRALSGLPPQVDILGASTADSQSVTVDYRVENAATTQPFVIRIDRASGPEPRPGGTTVARATVGPGRAVGDHELVIPVAGGLPPDPAWPYVVAVADATNPGATAGEAAAFRTHVIGVVVHGGVQDSKQRPLWELKLARELKAVGYDEVIAFNWAAQSNTPGDAAKQGPRLANQVRRASAAFPPSDPVDLHLIGHSEGAVVVSQALLSLQHRTTPQLRAGYLKVTLLDPHAANNHAPGGQISVAPGL
ncbi:MAG: hypothetical protein LC745_00885, partial [Planctomycetia bacterium]|nr:hypothetical protein [Planctomycetia bacterium]